MARCKPIDTSRRFLAVDLERQLVPGTFEHALNYLVDHELDLSRFDARYKNDFTGASAYPPGMLLKVVLFAYSRGIVSSREIERACREQVTFIALSGDSAPHFTPFADFVSTLGAEIKPLFTEILLLCDRMGLIGREMFAIEGVKLPGNASKGKSGTRICPAGKSLYQNGAHCVHNGHLAVKFQGALRDCVPCTLRDRCLRKPETTKTRQVCFFYGKTPGATASYTERMKRAIDSERGRRLYGRRFATVEPVFANIRHNIEKLAHHGYAQ